MEGCALKIHQYYYVLNGPEDGHVTKIKRNLFFFITSEIE